MAANNSAAFSKLPADSKLFSALVGKCVGIFCADGPSGRLLGDGGKCCRSSRNTRTISRRSKAAAMAGSDPAMAGNQAAFA